MKRNWDIVRKILLAVEALPDEGSQFNSGELIGHDNEIVAYQMRLLLEAKLIEGGCRNMTGPAWCYAIRLTWAGHEFLDNIRRDSVWNDIKNNAREKGVDLSLDVIKDTAKAIVIAIMGG